ncbi:MAG: GAF domain-containing protein [Bacteroidetes bacterium]|nr:GAF domain-containing protein [Bacteroidota bacterium]MCL5025147.1 GAF domain-containing protein [Chloroflexota bacterium]
MLFREVTIGQRLALAFGGVLVFLLVLAGVYAYGQQRQSDVEASLTDRVMPRAEAASDIETAYLRQSASASSYVYSGDAHYLDEYQGAVAIGREAVARLNELPKNPQGTAIFEQIQPLATAFTQASEKAISFRQQGNIDEAEQVVEQEMIPARAQLLAKAEEFVALQSRLRDDAKAQMSQVKTDTAREFFGIALLTFVGGAAVSVGTSRSVRNPARTLVQASRALAGGDFAACVDLAGKVEDPKVAGGTAQEMRELAATFGSMTKQLLGREKRLAARAALSAALASSLGLDQIAKDGLRVIADYTNSELGAVYVCYPGDGGAAALRRIGSYAIDGSPASFNLGEGIPGEAAASRRSVVVRDIPADTPFHIKFGFDQAPPRTVVAAPMIVQEQIVGVLLLGSLRDLGSEAIDFVEISAQQVGVSLQNALAHHQVQALAEELRDKNELLAAQNEELQAQSEEIQAQNEELQSQSEELQAQNEELQAQSEELQAQSTELAEQNHTLAQQAERIARLQSLTARLNESLSTQEILEQVVWAAVDLLESSVAAVLLLDPSRHFFTLAAGVGLDPEEGLSLRLPYEESLAGRVMTEGRVRFIEDVSQEPNIRFPYLASGQAPGSMIVAPMYASGNALGVVEVYFSTHRTFTDDDVSMLSALANAVAVTVHKARLYAEVEDKRQLLESILVNVPEAVCVTDRQGSVLIANAPAYELFDIDESGSLPLSVHRDEVGADTCRPITRALSGEQVLGEEVHFSGAGGKRTGYAQVSAVPLFSGGRVDGAIAVATDITHLKEIDLMKDEFLSLASHELRSPLTSIKGFAQFLHRRMRTLPNYEDFQSILQTVDEQVNKAALLVDRLLDVSRAQMGRLQMNPEQVDLGDLVREHVRQAQVKTDKHRLITDIGGQIIGYWDRGYLEQAIANLVDNAIRYSPEGGEVRVSVQLEGDTARVTVVDQGIGIPQDLLPHLFKRYYRAQAAREISADSMGIGLYITREIIAAHGGRIWAEGAPEKGSVFTIELPLSYQPANNPLADAGVTDTEDGR